MWAVCADMRSDVQKIFVKTPVEKQVMMFSATLSPEVRTVARRFMSDVSFRGVLAVLATCCARGLHWRWEGGGGSCPAVTLFVLVVPLTSFAQPMEIHIDDQKLRLHGLQQYFCT